jgi:hypothetical protein
MLFAGIIVTFLGFCLAVASVGITQSTGGRMGLVLVGIVISLVGIIGVLNQYYLKNAIWKK